MRASWHALHSDLVRSTTTLSFQRQFDHLRASSAALQQFRDPSALLDHLHGPGGDPADRNLVLRELAAAAQTPEAQKVSVTLLLLALWPGLDAVHGRLSRYFRTEPDALTAELTGRLSIAIRGLDLSRVNKIAATLLRNLERDIKRELQAGWREAAVPEDAPEPAAPDAPDPDMEAIRCGKRLIELLGPDDGALVFTIAVLGDQQNEAADRLGLGGEAARKRYQRARQRLRALPEEIF